MLFAMNNWNRSAPITLATHTPVTQTPSGFFLANLLVLQGFGDGFKTLFKSKAVINTRINRKTIAFFSIPVLPLLVVKNQILAFVIFNPHYLFTLNLVFGGKFPITGIVSRYTHNSTIAVRHQDIITNPNWNSQASNRVGNRKASKHTDFFFDCHFGFSGAAFLAFLNKGY